MSDPKPIYVVQHNHFDPIWRRCWDRTFDYNGMRYRSYAELEELVFNIWLDNARRGGTFSEGQAVVVRKYLERNPERLDELRALVASGQFELTAAGETVPDTNMPSGETLLRNLVLGLRWLEETFGVLPTIGWVEDAFGQSAQLPQLFRGCGVKQVLKRSYKVVPGQYWRGLDGSVVCTVDAPAFVIAGGQGKIPPCPDCRGFGCEACENTGFARRGYITDEHARERLAASFDGDPCSVFSAGDEESIPNPRLPELVEEANARLGTPRFRWGTYADVARHYADLVDAVDDAGLELSDQVEANPVSTGCYITRIRIKQRFRRLEHALVAAEKWATVAWLHGAGYPEEDLREAWRRVLFAAFHDAITSTHIDAAYQELMEMFDDADTRIGRVLDASLSHIETGLPPVPDPHNRLVVYNAESWGRTDPVIAVLPRGPGRPVLETEDGEPVQLLDFESKPEGMRVVFTPPEVPPLGYQTIRVVEYEEIPEPEVFDSPCEVSNGFFHVGIGERGIESIVDVHGAGEIVNPDTFLANELLLEEDVGHPWGTQKPPAFAERLSRDTNSIRIAEMEGATKVLLTGSYGGRDPLVQELAWLQEVVLYRDVRRIDFRTTVIWNTRNRRLKVVFPTRFPTSRATYAIPYGALERGPYEPNVRIHPATDGDWPAVNWVDVHNETGGVALLNRGTPAHKVEGGAIFMSLLRSPVLSWCLNEPEFYDCPDFDGARDTNRHVFEYALVPHGDSWQTAEIEQRAREYNTPMIARRPAVAGSGERGPRHGFLTTKGAKSIVVSAIKKAERVDGVAIRLAETAGKKGRATVGLAGAAGAQSLVDFLERDGQPVKNGTVNLGPFKIATLQVARS